MKLRNRLYGLGLGVALLSAGSLAAAPFAGAVCYPGSCAGRDAAVQGINAPATLDHTHPNTVEVDGKNVGTADTNTRTALRSPDNNRRHPRAVAISPRFVYMWVPVGDTYSVFFGVRPRHAHGDTTLRGCSRAMPEDADSSNNCMFATVPNS